MKKIILILVFTLLLSCNVFAEFVPNDPNVDNTPIFNEMIANMSDDNKIEFPVGKFWFNTKPNTIDKNIQIIGAGINATTLMRNFQPEDYGDALFRAHRTIIIKHLAIIASESSQGGSAIFLYGRATNASVLRDLYISARPGGNYEIPLILKGTGNLGIRACHIDNVEIFAATHHSAWFYKVKGLTAKFNAYHAGGIVSHITVQESDNIQIQTRYLERVYIYTTTHFSLWGFGYTDLIVDDWSFNIIQF